ncbi:MAG: penicillin-binding transpeptidase domain-containing protein [Bacillota bacterium]|nr:penicillin-binding transpeptidase domain-containing protein [Bacillota bacterium]
MKKIIFIPLLIVIAIILPLGCTKSQTPKDAFEAYLNAWNKSNFEAMYNNISEENKKNIKKDDFIKKYINIYNGIEVSKLSVKATYPSSYKTDKEGKISIPYTVSMETAAGTIKFTSTAFLKQDSTNKEKVWHVIWSNKMIFPDLSDDDKVRIAKKPGLRGQILDRNGVALAANGSAAEIGIVPAKLGTDAENSKNQISQILNITVDQINKKLTASYVKSDMYVPIDVISKNNTDKLTKLSSIPGVAIHDKDSRVYPLMAKAAHLIGYVQKVTSDDLKNLKGEGYSTDDYIGKAGLERIYEKTLRATNGAEIYIVDSKGNKKKTIAKKDPKNGTDLKLTIDSNIQASIFDQLNNEPGTGVVLQPKTGEVLALVSSPSYDPNDFVLGMSNAEWQTLNTDANKPLTNRFQKTFSPGSTFKPITTAIALKTNKLTTDSTKNITGLKWQKDKSWGNYFVTRVEEYGGPANLLNALVHSDNIFFAQTALDIGSDNLINETKNFGIGETLPFEYALNDSVISTNGTIKNDIQLADSGYGQGEVMVNPVHLADIYTSFVNNGNIINPYLQYKDNPSPSVWKQNVFSSDIANTILGDLSQVVTNNEGTGHESYMPDIPLAGKTGTAEIKATQGASNGTENGWFVAVNTNNPKLLVLCMIENVKDKGGSHYVVPKVKNIFSQYGK